MDLAPEIVAFLNAAPNEPPGILTIAEQRKLALCASDENYRRFGRRAEPVASITDHTVPVVGGEIRVRSYRPSAQTPLPAHVVLHGGAWWLGSIDELVNEAICRHRCLNAGCVVFAVDYRLAPEHPFPTAIEDAYAALCWVTAHAAELGIDAGSVSIGGTSAGGNLAAAVAIKARDLCGPRLVFQLLEVPALDLTGTSFRVGLRTADLRSIPRHADDLDRFLKGFITGLEHYLPDPTEALLPLASPLCCDDLSGLPPTHIMTAQFDPLRVESEHYAWELAAAGVHTTHSCQDGAIHGMDVVTRVSAPAREWQREAAITLRSAHWPRPVRSVTEAPRRMTTWWPV